MADLATLILRRDAAEEAYDAMMRGEQLTEIKHNERTMAYAKADPAQLKAYIADLNGQIARLEAGGTVSGRRGRSRAIFF